ncbi:hypothetical protein PCYB_082490 [Plasmodium cynomolgi strain B]|uniref:Splicing factor YJU2 n=1 Tax=Plasmodium cynomolgi (strain B) TaxID=1120755 RepID=K6UJN5_PLACD|nr:hypothetical protein PCYB_082490 [Plasmodium cynomolgi strain B]GAB66088.1 hypothetical protein PCYB_082490 [Plasmodium cynomolgi strain B]
MAERKVLNKYIPPDFDPDKLTESKKLMKKIERKKNKSNKYNKKKKHFLNIRMMYPFTLKCNKCKSFTYVGTKFNSKVEKLRDESYLNIPIWQFYGKCFECKNEIIFKTDPKNGDYILIAGGIRTYDAHKEQEIADDYYRENNIIKEEDKLKNKEKESYNALLELKTNEQLEELKNINRRHIDKFNSINKALHKLYEKSEMNNNKNNFFMNNLDSEDEKAFFTLLRKSRAAADQPGGATTGSIAAEDDVIIEEEVLEEEDAGEASEEEAGPYNSDSQSGDSQKGDSQNGDSQNGDSHNSNCDESARDDTLQKSPLRKTKEFSEGAKKRHIHSDEAAKAGMEGAIKVRRTNQVSTDGVQETEGPIPKPRISIFKSRLSVVGTAKSAKPNNFEKSYNFVIKKKDDLSSILNEYNSDTDGNSGGATNLLLHGCTTLVHFSPNVVVFTLDRIV